MAMESSKFDWSRFQRKVYVVSMTNKVFPMPDNDHVFVKVGITHHKDIMNRFNPAVDDGYAKNYNDWNIQPKFSQPFYNVVDAMEFEQYLLNDIIPASKYKVWVEDYLNIPDRNYYKNNTGITELRLLTKTQAGWFYRGLFENYKKALN